MKPASDTEKDTHEAASSDKTKQYGNGKTAGQIAVQNGAPAGTILHGPGNSQPHKAAPCSGGHEVDVHALKGKRLAKLCGPASPPGSNPGPGCEPGWQLERKRRLAVGRQHGRSGHQSTGPVACRSGLQLDGLRRAGIRGIGGSPRPRQALPVRAGSLPFTGFPLWIALLVGVGLILAGLWLVRRTEVTSRRGERAER